MKNPTVRQIAAAAGVSVATVSRVLSGRGLASPATAARVRRAADRMGWRPNPLASAYMAHLRSTADVSHRATLAFLTDFPTRDMPRYIETFYQAAAAQAASYGYRLTPFSLADPGVTPDSLDRELYSRSIDGLIVCGFHRHDPPLADFHWERYAAVAIGSALAQTRLHRVMVDYHHGFRLAIDRIHQLGYERLAVITSRDYDDKVGHALVSAAACVQTHPTPGRRLHLLELETNEPREMLRIQRWVKKVRPQIVLGVAPASRALRAMGWRVPRDVAFAWPDRHPDYAANAGFDQRHDLVGGLAAEVLAGLLTHNQRGIPRHPVEHRVHGEWADGPTAPPVAGSHATPA